MNESLSSASDKTGLPPGSLVHVGSVLVDETTMSVIDYSKESLVEHEIHAVDELVKYKNSDTITWVIVEGLANVDIVERIGELFQIHQLVLEDILNTHQRPKFEEHDDYLFIVLKALLPEGDKFTVVYEQISLLVLRNFVFAFKEKKDSLFHPVLQRIRTSKGRFRSLGADYLTYSILDAIIDQYFYLIDSLDLVIIEIEDNLLTNEPAKTLPNSIHRLKRDIVNIRRYTSPLRELVSGLLRSESSLIDEKTYIYLRDISDHVIRILESVEIHRDILSGLMEMYASTVSNRMNEVMKVLTVFASIFIPLTFFTGIYGMNFDYMPELKWKWAYPTLWIGFIAIPTALLIYFKKRNWL